jgi:hypothetical protein
MRSLPPLGRRLRHVVLFISRFTFSLGMVDLLLLGKRLLLILMILLLRVLRDVLMAMVEYSRHLCLVLLRVILTLRSPS